MPDRWKRGDLVLVWGRRVARVKDPKVSGDGRITLELVDGTDPPPGYTACWPVGEVELLPASGVQMPLFDGRF